VEFFCRTLDELAFSPEVEPASVLVAGCGAGHEAAFLQQELSARVTAVDAEIETPEEFAEWPDLEFREASVLDLPFEDARFDLVFYHHVIEHVADPERSLGELARVLRPSGWLFLGTPNRHRIISAVGAHQQRDWQSTVRAKLGENLQDWGARLRGRFQNELGAHAGFSTGGLDRMLARHFPTRRWLTREYLRFKYGGGRWRAVVGLLTCGALVCLTAPSIYVLCGKQ
jgi:SAM-dependent methyltransferase